MKKGDEACLRGTEWEGGRLAYDGQRLWRDASGDDDGDVWDNDDGDDDACDIINVVGVCDKDDDDDDEANDRVLAWRWRWGRPRGTLTTVSRSTPPPGWQPSIHIHLQANKQNKKQ